MTAFDAACYPLCAMPESDDTPLPADGSLPTILGGLNPEELLARGLHTVKMSSAGAHGWDPPALEEVARLFPSYELLGMLGRGGMGAVFKARQISLDRLVAIKLLPLEISVDQTFLDRFRREARAMAKLNHPHIITVFEFGQTAEGHLFFVMEFVDGANLADIIHGPGLTPDQSLSISAQVCTALAYAHGKGVVHRDIKPANVMIDTESQVKVADFGLARLIDSTAPDLGHTMTGTVMGTPDYMAPEQKRGMNVDHRADIYSLGVMLYEMLCRETPQGAFDPPSERIGCDPRLDKIVLKAMQQAPDRRYQSTQEMKTDVESARTPLPVVLPASAPFPKPPRSFAKAAVPKVAPNATKSHTLLYASIALAVVATIVATFSLSRPKTKRTAPATPPKTSATPQPPRASTPAATSQEKWVDALAAWWADNPAKRTGTMVKEAGGHRVTGYGGIYFALWIPNIAVRVVARDSEKGVWRLNLRNPGNDNQNAYVMALHRSGKGAILLVKDGQETELARFDAPPEFSPTDFHTAEFRARGDLLTASVDGREVARVRDRSHPKGHAFFMGTGALIEKLEYLDLGTLALPATTPAAFTKDAPAETHSFGGHRYQLVSGVLSWAEAKAKAEAVGGHLAVLTTKAEFDWVAKTFRARLDEGKNFASFWLGGTSANAGDGWKWSTGEPIANTFWAPFQPDIAAAGEQGGYPAFLNLHRNDTIVGLNDSSDTASPNRHWRNETIGFLVEWDSDASAASQAPAPVVPNVAVHEAVVFAGHRYQFVPDTLSWTEATAKAAALGGHLATIASKEENDFLVANFLGKIVDNYKGVWLGASAQSATAGWKWVTGEPFSFTAWGTTEPNTNQRDRDDTFPYGLSLFRADDTYAGRFGWNDVAVGGGMWKTQMKGFIVEWEDASSVGQAVVSGATPAAAQARPFTNTLGMRFVPVPITGGPSGGQRVLFSVWETRVQDYEAFAKETQREWQKADFEQGPTHPAVDMGWEDAGAFCQWLTERERKAGRIGAGESYRLPSDHEWSCAVGLGERENPGKTPEEKKGKITGEYPWGTPWPPSAGAGNYFGEEGRPARAAGKYPWIMGVLAGYRDGFVETAPVGSFSANGFGLFDMSGNVWQWCNDLFNENRKNRVLRGGSWDNSHDSDLLSSHRFHISPDHRGSNIGFRCVLAPAASAPPAALPQAKP